jgi:hypothetical protein
MSFFLYQLLSKTINRRLKRFLPSRLNSNTTLITQGMPSPTATDHIGFDLLDSIHLWSEGRLAIFRLHAYRLGNTRDKSPALDESVRVALRRL